MQHTSNAETAIAAADSTREKGFRDLPIHDIQMNHARLW
jgi:hypothetical protein